MRPILILLILTSLLPACVGSSNGRRAARLSLGKQESTTESVEAAALPALTIVQASSTITPVEKKFQINLPISVPTSTLLPTNLISSLCPTSPSPFCECVFEWTERNTTELQSDSTTSDPKSVDFARMAVMPVITSQQALAVCEMPPPYSGEIGAGQEIRVHLRPVPENRTPFTTNTITVKKPGPGADTATASFVDNEGNRLNNIWRYTCHERIRRGASLESETYEVTSRPPNNLNFEYREQVKISLASRFKVEKFKDTTRPVLATQLNYFSLYVPHNNLILNRQNDAYSCPQVESAGLIRSNSQKQYFPFDTSFALASQSSKTFNVPVEARSRLSLSTDPQSNQNFSCTPAATGTTEQDPLGNNGLVVACLGWAASPSASGDCASITVGNTTRRMYRLRRFNALYPPIYDTNGLWISGYQARVDQVYVLDRPATFTVSGAPPVSGTMQGPKPCPFAWYDRTGATGSAGYKSTNDSSWSGVNPDGIALPTTDVAGESCPAVLPYNYAGSGNRAKFRLRTLADKDGKKDPDSWIRPLQAAWEPIYWEDTSFKACAPADNELVPVRAPVHYYQGGGAASYCEEVYPTAHHADSTAHRDDGGTKSKIHADFLCSGNCEQYPLQAFKDEIEQALLKTQSYGCVATAVTSHPDLVGKQFPSACCKDKSGTGHAETCSSYPSN